MSETFRERMFRAWTLLQLRKGQQLSQQWLGRELGLELGRESAVDQGLISYWLSGKKTPGDYETMVGLARVLGVDPGWLAFGEASEAPGPPDPFRMDPTERP